MSAVTRITASSKSWLRHVALVAAALYAPALLADDSRGTPFEVASLAPGMRLIGEDVKLPQLLSAQDGALYRTIFDLQRDGRWAEADARIARLSDRILIGHVLLQRYMHAHYRSSWTELSNWLRDHADLPGAERVWRLADRRRPDGAPKAPAPMAPDVGVFAASGGQGEERPPVPTRQRNAEDRRVIGDLQALVLEAIRAGQPEQAELELAVPALKQRLEAAEYDELRRRVATGYYMAGQDGKALALARLAAKRSRTAVPMADWTAGLAAWRLQRFEMARQHFAALARAPNAADWDVAAGAYWAARAALRARKPDQVNRMLEIASRHPRTFYGMLAGRQLGIDVAYTWDMRPLTARQLRRLQQVPALRRAVALVEAGQNESAMAEIRRLYLRGNDDLGQILLGLASRLDVPAAAMRLGEDWRERRGKNFDGALYPLPPWEPEGGYVLDRALVYAFMRQESAFDSQATSPSGAAGLMQIMPSTARFVASSSGMETVARDGLLAPELNIDLGQRYLRHLLDLDLVGNNLILMAAAYNSGPGNLKRWLKDIRFDDDPLLFMESVPAWETRAFIGRVLTNYWIYSERLGRDTPSLDALAAGNWPYYAGQDEANFAVAENEPN